MNVLRRFHFIRKPEVFRCVSSVSSCESVVAEPLEQRGLVRVAGEEVYGFLQGLMTNDISHVQSGISSMYSMFLNTRGRVIYDTIIYQSAEPGVLYIECDSSVTSSLSKHLKVYRLRKKVSIDVEDSYKVWSVYEPSINQNQHPINLVDDMRDHLLGKVLPCEELELSKKERKDGFSINSISSKNNVLIFRDPRISELGLRVVCPSSEDLTKSLGVGRGSSYRFLRYCLGVGEGVLDLPPDQCFPLEANCDYLHGVSFHKGCYIGQELTARVYHTGVVRKRLMPLLLDGSITESNALKQEVLNENNKAVGKVRGVEGLSALGVLRISEVLSAKSLTLCSTNVKTMRPSWWPKQAPKELESRDKQ
ncbi:putative transferase CAF17 homolog, mitochondrial [Thrips palmi]|uniref:Transferase CAF17 homolog, mitochondrial n=1 Tax=Thrips palmi TaxID=161013 RepID=A0A6P8ZL36_THRPL|nr:putative transferase CAF17 homolog, mitochondrial [Thrips palmi]